MDKYSEEKEGNQWDDDFIFDSAPLPVRKRGTSAAAAITSHLSTSSSAVQKDKRKSTASWNNAFKKIEADPRHTRTTSTASSGKSSAISTTSTTKNIVQSHSTTPRSSGGGEFAFFDSDDCVGFGQPGRSGRPSPWPSSESQTGSSTSYHPHRNTVSNNGLPPTPPPLPSLTKQPYERIHDTATETASLDFDDGLGEGNLGFNDDDYIPNIGFDDLDDYPTPSRSQPMQQPVQYSTTASISSNLSSSIRNSSLSSDSGSRRVHPTPYSMHPHNSGGSHHRHTAPLHLNSTSSDLLLASSSSVVGEQLLEEILENDEPLSFDVVDTLANASAGDNISLLGSNAGIRNPHAYTREDSGSNYIGVPLLHRSTSGSSSLLASRGLGQRPPANPLNAARISSYGYLAALSLSDDSPRTAGTSAVASPIRTLSTSLAGSSTNSPFPRTSLQSPGGVSECGVEPSPTVSVKERIRQYERREYINESPASEDSDSSDSVQTSDKRISNNTAQTGVGTSGSHGEHRHEDHPYSDDENDSYSHTHSGEYSSRSYSSYDHSCSHSGSHSGSDFVSVSEFDSQNSDEFTEEEKEDAEEGDWDLDLEPATKPCALHSAQTFKDIITGRVAGTQGGMEEEEAPETERESLLDFLKTTVQKTIVPSPRSLLGSPGEMEATARELLERSYDSADGDGGGLPVDAKMDTSMGRSTLGQSVSTPSLSSRDYNMEAYEEEGHNVETANPHLRGLLSWVDATTQCFNSILTAANSSTTHNARILLHTEVDLPGGDDFYMEKLLERCEQLHSSSNTIPTLEIVSKWLRALCNLYDKIIGSLQYSTANSSNDYDHGGDFDMRSSSNSSSGPPKVRRTASLGEAKFHQFAHTAASKDKNDQLHFGDFSGRRIAHIYDWCDSILQDQLFSTTTALGTNYRKLLSATSTTSSMYKHSAYGAGPLHRDGNSHSSSSSMSVDTEWCLQNNTTNKKDNWLVNMGMVAVKDPVYYDNTSSNPTQQLLQLRCISAPSDDDMLITDTIRLSSNLMSLYRLQINMLEIRIHMYDGFELVACLELLQKISEELEKITSTLFASLRRALPHKERCTLEQSAQLTHIDSLSIVAGDLLGCCFSIKICAICCVSPINFQNLPEHCQHINQNIQEIAKVNTFDNHSNSEDGYPILGTTTGSGSATDTGKTTIRKKTTITYNVIYELTLGTHFLDVMLTLSSPSVVRSKIYLSVYTYLQRLKKKQLPWQNRQYKLISLKQQLDSFANIFNLYQGSDTFGLNYADMDNNSFALSLIEVEGSIVQSFAEVFGSLDQHRIEQLLLFESANEMLPSVIREETKGPAAYLRRHPPPPQSQGTEQGQSTEQPATNKEGDRGESDLSDLNHRSSKQPWGVFTSMRSAFRHLSAALNLDTSLIWGKRQSDSSQHTAGGTTTQHLYLLNNAPTRSKLKGGLSYNARYELFYFSYHILYRLAQAIIEMSPNIALDVLQLCILLLGHLRHSQEKGRIEKICVMLAVKVGRRDAAIWHGEAVLHNLQLKGDNVNEMLYMTDLLAAQYSENAQYELAAKALFSAISALNNRNKGGASLLPPGSPQHWSRNSMSRKECTRSRSSLAAVGDPSGAMEFERTLDPLLLKLGKLLLHFGCPDRAADTFQVLLSSLCERTDCLANDAKKVTVLSWLAEAYIELEDHATCISVVKAIKTVRNLKLHKVTRAVRLERVSIRREAAGNSMKLSRKSSKSKSITPPISLSRTQSGTGLFGSRSNSKYFFAADNSPSPSSSSHQEAQQTPTSTPRDPALTPPAVVGATDAVENTVSEGAATTSVSAAHHRGIAVQSADSFDFDHTNNKIEVRREKSTEKVLPYHQNSNSSSGVQDSDVLRWRPLPATPRGVVPVPPRCIPDAHLSSPSTTTGSGQRKSKLLRKRPPPLAPIDSLEQLRGHSSETPILPGNNSIEEQTQTPPVQGSCDSTPTPTNMTGTGLKRSLSKRKRKSRLLKNLQDLHVSNSNNNLGRGSPTEQSNRNENQVAATAIENSTTGTSAHPLPPPTPFPHATSTSTSSNRNSNLSSAAAVGSLYLHYLRNPPEANLPQFCVTVDDIDLGSLKARIHYKNKKYIEALKYLLPTLIGVELMVIGSSQRVVSKGTAKHDTQPQPQWSRQALLELGDLYYLRGKIQLAAAKSSSEVSYPVQIGSRDLFDRVQSALAVSAPAPPTVAACVSPRVNATGPADTPRAATGLQYGVQRRFARNTRSKRTRRDGSNTVAGPNSGTAAITSPNSFVQKDMHHHHTIPTSDVLNMTCREPKRYENPADMCYDALQWFQRAKDVARIAGDEIGGALAANALASCHLLPAFSSHALFKVPLDKALDLSTTPTTTAATATAATATAGTTTATPAPATVSVSKKASLREVQQSMVWALEVHSQSCLPLPLMEAYMNLAEMYELLGNASDGLAFWAETKELFMHLFADGMLIPLVRRASAGFVRKLQAILNRIVRFMWVLDREAVNTCLYLLDIHVLLQHEVDRMVHRNTSRAHIVSSWLPDVLSRILHPEGPVEPLWEEQQEKLRKRKRSTISRVSRFFTRLFSLDPTTNTTANTTTTNTAHSSESNTQSITNRKSLSASLRSTNKQLQQSPADVAASSRHSNRYSSSSRQHTPDSHAHSSPVNKTGTKASDSFDGFIERSGFTTQLDMRRFYNIMNAGLVAEKVYDFGWSNSVEYEQLLKPVLRDHNPSSTSEAEQQRSSGMKDRPCSISSISTAQPVFSNSSGKHSPRAGQGVCGVEALIVLNLRSKLDYASKYRTVTSAPYLQEHLLSPSMFITAEEDEMDSVFGDNKDYSPLPGAPIASLARSNSLLGLSPRSGRPIKRTVSSGIGEQACMNLDPLSAATGDDKNTGSFELPLDPFVDFDWMDESFADYTPHSRSLQARAVYDRQHSYAAGTTNTTSRSRYKRGILGAESAQFPSMFMPEFNEAHAYTAQEIQNSQNKHHHRAESGSSGTLAWEQQGDSQLNSTATSAPALLSEDFSAEYLRDLDQRAETILIQRIWRCYMLVQNARKGYRSGQRSIGLLRHDVRSALSSLCLNMVRLRAFSRQYQPSVLEFDKLHDNLCNLPASLSSHGHTSVMENTIDVNMKEEDILLRYRNGQITTEEVSALRKVMKEQKRKQPVLLQHRLPFVVYTIHIEDCLLLYRPQDGSRTVQKLGGSGFLTLTGSYVQGGEQQDTATVSSVPHSTATATSPPLGIAEKYIHETRKFEQKISLLSMLSFISAGSDVTRDSSMVSHTHRIEGKGFFSRSRSWLLGKSPRTPSSGGSFFPSDMSSSDISSSLPYTAPAGATESVPQVPTTMEQANSTDMHTHNTKNSTVGKNFRAREALLEGSDYFTNSAVGTASADNSDPSSVVVASAAPPKLRLCDTKLLFDLTAGCADQECGKDKEARNTIFTELREPSSALSTSLQFIQAVGESISKRGLLDQEIAGDKKTSFNSSLLSGAAVKKPGPGTPSKAAVTALRCESTEEASSALAASSLIGLSSSMSNILGLFSSSDSGEATLRQMKERGEDHEEGSPHRAPCKQIPMTLISTPSVAVLPWEALLIKSKICMVRQVGLIALCAHTLNSQHWLLQPPTEDTAPIESATIAHAVVGPRRNQKPAFVAVGYKAEELDAACVKASFARVGSASITALGHSTSHLHTNMSSMTVQEDSESPLQGQVASRPSSLACSVDARVFPLPSQLCNQQTATRSPLLGKADILTAGCSMKLNENHRFASLKDFWRCLPARPPPTLRHQGRKGLEMTVPFSPFPLLILSYADYVALSDAVAWVISTQPEAVLVFAPTFLQEPLCIELKLCLDRWCKPDITVSPPSSPAGAGKSQSHSDGTESSITMPGAYGRSRSEGSSGVLLFSGFRSMGSSGSAERPESTAEYASHSSGTGSRPGIRSFGTLLSKTAASLLPGRTTASPAGNAHQQLEPSFESQQQQQYCTSSSRFGSGAMSGKGPTLPVIAEEKAKRSPTAGRSKDVTAAVGGQEVAEYILHNSTSTTSAGRPNLLTRSHSSDDIETSAASLHLLSSDREPSKNSIDSRRGSRTLRGKDRTWVYHAVMSVVQSLQDEYQAPIIVFA